MGYVYGDRIGIPIEILITLRNINAEGDDFLSRCMHVCTAGAERVWRERLTVVYSLTLKSKGYVCLMAVDDTDKRIYHHFVCGIN